MPRLSRPVLTGPAVPGTAVLGGAVVALGLGGPVGVVAAVALAWLFWGRPLGLAALFAVALTLSAWATAGRPPAAAAAPAAARAGG